MKYAQCDAEPKAGSEMDMIASRISSVAQSLAVQNERLLAISNRLVGALPSKGEACATAPRPVPNGHISQFNMDLDEICNSLVRGEELLTRLNKAV